MYMKTPFTFVLICILIFPSLILGRTIEDGHPDELPDIRITDLKVANACPVLSEEGNIKYEHLFAAINPRNNLGELNFNNNITLNLMVDGKDLQARALSVHSNKYIENEQRSVTIDFEIINLGNQDVVSPFRTKIRGLPENGSPMDGFINILSLKSDETTYVSYTFVGAPKQFKISIDVDIDNNVEEVNENNSLTDLYRAVVTPINRWQSIGPSFIKDVHPQGYPWDEATGRLSAIAIHPNNPKIIYVGGRGSGIWKTNRSDRAWHPITNHISMSVAAIALDPNSPSTIFWATETEGFYRSNNGGLSWKQLTTDNLRSMVHGGKLIVSPLDSNILFLASENGVNRSLDGGVTWSLVKQGANVKTDGTTTGLVMSPSNPNIIYASFRHQTNNTIAGVFKSADGGTTWRKIQGCPGSVRLPIDMTGKKITLAISENTLYVGIQSSTDFQLYRTSDTSCSIGGILEQVFEKGWRTTTQHKSLWGNLWVNPLDSEHLYMGGTDFWHSKNGGMDFEKVSGYNTPKMSAHADHHAFSVLPDNKDVIFSLNDGGIYRSDQNAKKGTWKFIGKGISNIEFYDFAQAYTDSNLLLGGTQDNGIIKTNNSLEWRAQQGGDGSTVDIDNNDKNIMYSLGQYINSIRRSTNGGIDWNLMVNGLPEQNICGNLIFGIHPTKSNILLAPCNDLWRITNPNSSWEKIFTPNSGSVVRWAIDPSKDLYFVGTNNGVVSAGIGGNNWTQIFVHPSNAAITDIKVDPINTKIVWITFADNNGERVYKLKRNSSNTFNFTSLDITGNIPANLPVFSIAVDRMAEHVVYVGTTKGVYQGKSLDQGTTWSWTTYNDGLPLAWITDLDVHPVSGILRASTFGRSAYQVATGPTIGSTQSIEGKLSFLRIHDVGGKYGPPNDILDTEIIVKLDTDSRMAFGLQLRPGNLEITQTGMLNQLRDAFKKDFKIRLEYVKTGINSGTILRVINKN